MADRAAGLVGARSRCPRVWVIVIITYVIGIGHFRHAIAGAVDVFAAAAGDVTWSPSLLGFVVPAFPGNVLRGLILVACLSSYGRQASRWFPI